MIISNKDHCSEYFGIDENLDKALRYIAKTDLGKLPDDTYHIDGEDVRVTILHMTTALPEKAKLESHEAFADIQMVLEGEETYLLCNQGEHVTVTETKPERDVAFYDGPAWPVKLTAGQFIVLLPGEIHGPGVCCGKPEQIRKAIFKVRIQ